MKDWFNSTQPGLVHGICHEEGDSWKVQVKARAQNGKVKTLTVDVDTAYVNCKFGKTFAKFVYNKPALIEEQSHQVSWDETICLNEKAVKGVKYMKGTEIKRIRTYYEKIIFKPEKEPIYDEAVLSGGQRRPKKKDVNPGDQIITKEKDKTPAKIYVMQ